MYSHARRYYLQKIALSGLTLAIPSHIFSSKSQRILNIAFLQPNDYPLFDLVLKKMSHSVDLESNGLLKIEFTKIKLPTYNKSQLIKLFEQYDGVYTTPYHFHTFDPALSAYANLPEHYSSTALNNWYYGHGGHQFVNNIYKPIGLTHFLLGSSPRIPTWLNRRLQIDVDTNKDVKIHTRGLNDLLVNHLGMSSDLSNIDISIQAFNKGTTVGIQRLGAYCDSHDLNLDWSRVALTDYELLPRGTVSFSLLFNTKTWDKLNKSGQANLINNIYKANQELTYNWQILEHTTLKKLALGRNKSLSAAGLAKVNYGSSDITLAAIANNKNSLQSYLQYKNFANKQKKIS
jgi:TRAP-type mannitol/chloroaromatic compound transport system substrate-binding protein